MAVNDLQIGDRFWCEGELLCKIADEMFFQVNAPERGLNDSAWLGDKKITREES